MSFLSGGSIRPPPTDSPFAARRAPRNSTPSSGMPPEPNQAASQNQDDRPPQQAPLFAPPRHNRTSQGPTLTGPSLAPLSATRPSSALQQPLPPLRSLNRDALSSQIGIPYLLTRLNPLFVTAPSLHGFSSHHSAQQSSAPSPTNPLSFSSSAGRARPSSLTSAISMLDQIGHNLDDANSHLRALLDMPSPDDLLNHLPPSLSTPLPPMLSSRAAAAGAVGSRREPAHAEDSGRMNKRRKLDSDRANPPPSKSFRYGRYGQVEPGALTMEIVSCDGGIYSDGTSYAAENILKTDNSVYCTKGNRCNIVLQHQDCTTFSLKELIIKAPARNYSAPVREGMVFLSMTKDELLRTEQYHSNAAPTASPSQFLSFDSRRSHEAHHLLHDVHDGGGDPHAPPFEEIYNLALGGSENTPFAGRAEPGLARYPPTFHVMTECSDDEEDEAYLRAEEERGANTGGWRRAAGWSPSPLRTRPGRRMPIYEDPAPFGTHLISWDVENNFDYDEDDDYTELYDIGDATISSPDSPNEDGEGRGAPRARTARDSNRVYVRVRDRGVQRQEDGGNGEGPSGSQTVLPHAEFHIETNKNKCTIRFDPPVTARYILLKMWNPSQDVGGGNIDIQGVWAKGFAGPRYFPAMELR